MWTLTIINHGEEKRDTCKGPGIDGGASHGLEVREEY